MDFCRTDRCWVKRIVSGHVGCSYITPCGEEGFGVQTTGKRTLRQMLVAREASVGGVKTGALWGWAGGSLVLVVMSCRVLSKMYAELTRSAGTKSCLPRTTFLNVLLVRVMILCSPLCCGSKARRMASCCRETCVKFLRPLWIGVVGGCTRSSSCR